ncbi:hypothetical protein [Burkholderia ambifaria]|uniref:hypothetical protein n=1 Tax=Burkholderia ambifaria TaxID=152480 RepID=UPI001C935A1C|nr:hypothetical protein [Burkholderia ambifaria]MBY4768952.1 hypothetical protein [Burkholderia ambifaria]
MRQAVRVFVDAVKETPRLYFAPLVAAINAVGRVESEMVTKRSKGPIRGRIAVGASGMHKMKLDAARRGVAKKAQAAKTAKKRAFKHAKR